MNKAWELGGCLNSGQTPDFYLPLKLVRPIDAPRPHTYNAGANTYHACDNLPLIYQLRKELYTLQCAIRDLADNF